MATPHLSQVIALSIDIPAYALDLSPLTSRHIVYNGKFTYIAPSTVYHPTSGWCHLLLVRGPSRWLAVITQTPDCGISVVNTIEHIASSVLSFFTSYLLHVGTPQDKDEESEEQVCELTPDTITFVQYLPAGCFRMRNAHQRDTYAVMKFSWEERQVDGQRTFQAGKPTDTRWIMGMWQDATRKDIENFIHNL